LAVNAAQAIHDPAQAVALFDVAALAPRSLVVPTGITDGVTGIAGLRGLFVGLGG
jgi:hypothetical protein